jgi:hypothetical protein
MRLRASRKSLDFTALSLARAGARVYARARAGGFNILLSSQHKLDSKLIERRGGI